MASNVDYKSAIDTCMSCYYSPTTLNSEAQELLAKLLNEINSGLLDKFREIHSSGPTDREVLHSAQNAVEQYYVGDLKAHAVAEAQRQLTLLETGVMEYEEGRGKTKGKKETSRSKKAQKNLASGIKKIFKNSKCDLKMAKAAEEGLSSRLSNLLNVIAAKAATNAADKQMTPKDVKKALEEMAQGALLKTLHSEGTRCLALSKHDICAKLAVKSAEKANTWMGKKELKPQNVEDAVDDILAELLAQHAKARARGPPMCSHTVHKK